MMSRIAMTVVLLSLVSMVIGIGMFQIWAPKRTLIRIQSSTPEPSLPDSQMSLRNIPLVDLQGRSQKLVEWKQPVLVVNFWAPWCVPCRREVPDLIALQNEYGARIQVLGLALDSAENIVSFADEHAMNYPSFLATSHISMYNAVFGNSSGALPFTAIVDQDRKINYSHTGQISLTELREQVSKLLQPDPD